MSKLLEFKNVTISLDDRVLYDNINLVINSGDRYIYLGPNGIGKSLLMELLVIGCCGDLTNRYKGLKVTGTIEDAEGNNILDPRVHRSIAYAQQQEDFYDNTTIVLCGDHTTMDSDFCNDVPGSYNRKVYTAFINSAAEPEDPSRSREYARPVPHNAGGTWLQHRGQPPGTWHKSVFV